MEKLHHRFLDAFVEDPRLGNNVPERVLQRADETGRWPDLNYEERHYEAAELSAYTASWGEHLIRVKALAAGWRDPESPLYRDPECLEAARRALRNYLDSDFSVDHWFANDIGTPLHMTDILLALKDELTSDTFDRAIAVQANASLNPDDIGMTGQNLIWRANLSLKRGVLTENPELVRLALAYILRELRLTKGEGIQHDYSFHQHGPLLYTFGYGYATATDMPRLARQLAGTEYAFPQEKIDLLSHYILDHMRWIIRHRVGDYGARGRSVVRSELQTGMVADACRDMLALPTGRDEEFRELIAHIEEGAPAPVSGNRHFWRSDFMAHQRPEFYTSARMHSSRVSAGDYPHNFEGLRNHHMADGANFLFLTGEEYRDVWGVYDWQKIPGSTVEQTGRYPGPKGIARTSTRDFVGGVSDGEYGAAAMILDRDGLTARKAWCFFDDFYVCMGSDIRCESMNPVHTTLNQVNLLGPVLVNGEEVSSGTHKLTGDWSVQHDQTLYAGSSTATLKVGTQRGNWHDLYHNRADKMVEREMFSLWIDHGRKPAGGAYEYVVYPVLTKDARVAGAHIVTRNDDTVQMVMWQREPSILAAVFYEAGSLEAESWPAIAVDKPCMLLLRKTEKGLALSASNPNGQALDLTVSIGEALHGPGAAPGASATEIRLPLPGGPNGGRSITAYYYHQAGDYEARPGSDVTFSVDPADSETLPPPLLHYNFDEPEGARIPDLANPEANGLVAPIGGVAADFLSADGEGVSGKPGDRAYHNPPLEKGNSGKLWSQGFQPGPMTSFTLCLWMKRGKSHSGGRLLQAVGEENLLLFASETAQMHLGQAKAQSDWAFFEEDEWIFQAVVFDGSRSLPEPNVRFYKGSTTAPARGAGEDLLLPLTEVWQGLGKQAQVAWGNAHGHTWNRPFIGYLDDIRFYPGALGPGQIETIRREALRD